MIAHHTHTHTLRTTYVRSDCHRSRRSLGKVRFQRHVQSEGSKAFRNTKLQESQLLTRYCSTTSPNRETTFETLEVDRCDQTSQTKAGTRVGAPTLFQLISVVSLARIGNHTRHKATRIPYDANTKGSLAKMLCCACHQAPGWGPSNSTTCHAEFEAGSCLINSTI